MTYNMKMLPALSGQLPDIEMRKLVEEFERVRQSQVARVNAEMLGRKSPSTPDTKQRA